MRQICEPYMKINFVSVFPKFKDGIPRATEELLKAICNDDRIDSLLIITRQDLGFINPSLLANRKISLFLVNRFLTPLQLLKVIKRYKDGDLFILFAPPWDVLDPLADLYLFLSLIKYHFLPRWKLVQALHDYIPYVCSKDIREEKRTLKLNNGFKRYFRTVPVKYVAVSESTKRDAMRYWGLSADRIAVIHHGSFITPKSPRTHFGSKKVLMVSDVSPRKNQTRLIKAFELVHRKRRDAAELIIVGNVRKGVPEFEATLRDIRRRNKGIKITTCGYLSDSEIRSLYDQADVFVYPSLYEGFGLPVLEAMATGCPVITSNLSSLPEVVGDAGLLVDPYNVEELAQAMMTVLEDDALKKEMSRKSVVQAQQFSWDKASEAWLLVCSVLQRATVLRAEQ